MHYRNLETTTVDGITYTWAIAVDDMPIRGNVMASGDDAHDKAAEQWVIDELDAGNDAAWCTVRCTAQVGSCEGTAYLGGCSYADEKALMTDLAGDLGQQAYDDLVANVKAAVAVLP